MILTVSSEGGTLSMSLRDPDDFRGFKVSLPDAESLDSLAPFLKGFGDVIDAEHMFVRQSALIEVAAARGTDPEWREGLSQMTAYAASKGWTNAAGDVRAHFDREALQEG